MIPALAPAGPDVGTTSEMVPVSRIASPAREVRNTRARRTSPESAGVSAGPGVPFAHAASDAAVTTRKKNARAAEKRRVVELRGVFTARTLPGRATGFKERRTT